MMKIRKGQSTLEYALLITIVLAAFVATSYYLKRGIQGRWKANVDELGEQYDPTVMATNIHHTMTGNSISSVTTQPVIVNGVPGVITSRVDISDVTETKKGSSTTGGY